VTGGGDHVVPSDSFRQFPIPADLRAAAQPFPVEHHPIANEPFHPVGRVGQPKLPTCSARSADFIRRQYILKPP